MHRGQRVFRTQRAAVDFMDNAMLDNQTVITYITDFLGGSIYASMYSAAKRLVFG